MVKNDLVKAVAAKAGCNHETANNAIDAVFAALADDLCKGYQTTIQGFGTFKVVKKAERTAFNPRTKEKVLVPAKKVVSFTPSAKLKESVNK